MPVILASEKPRQEDCCKFKTSLFWFVCFLNKTLSKNSINNKRYLPSWTRKLVREQEVIFLLKLNGPLAAEAAPGGLALGWGGVGRSEVGWGVCPLALSAKTFCEPDAPKTFVLQFVHGKRHSPKFCWTI